jgi:uncharacterized membrane protein
MPASRKGACALVVLALICTPVLSGCAGGETQPASAESHSGIVDSFIAKLKREDDENEVRELAENAPITKEEREEAREQAEEQEIEAEQAHEAEEQPGEQPQAEEQPQALKGQES